MNKPSNPKPTAPSYAIEASPVRSLPIHDSSERFPVNRMFCVGRNYADHAREMGHDPDREPPFFFMKPSSALVSDGAPFPYPTLSTDVQHEIEMVVALAQGGTDIPSASALQHVYGYAVGLDMTRRDLQNQAKKQGRPWDTGKAFDHSAPCSAIVRATKIGHPSEGAITLSVNGAVRQQGDLSELIWNVPDTIAYLSTLFRLLPGDLIFTGTPAGVGPVARGDLMVGAVAGVGELRVTVA